MNSEELSKLAQETRTALDAIWNTLGLTNEERVIELDKLIQEVRSVYTRKVDIERNNVDNMRLEVATILDKISLIRKQLELNDTFKERQGSLRDIYQGYKQDLLYYENKREELENIICQDLCTLHDIWARLGIELKPTYESVGDDISIVRSQNILNEIKLAKEEVDRRKQAVKELCKEIAEQLEELKLDDEANERSNTQISNAITSSNLVGPDIALSLITTEFNELDQAILTHQIDNIGVHSSTIKLLEEKTDILTKMRIERDSKLREMAQKITHLWVRLAVPAEEQQAWIRNHKGLSIKSLRSCQLELIRLLHLKQASLSTLIIHAKEKLDELYIELCISDDEQKELTAHLNTNEVNDELLDGYENLIKHLDLRASAMRPLLKLVHKREQLKEEQAELLRSQQDPNRFKIAGRLIQEEKIRNRLEKLIPKADMELRAGIPAWEAQYGEFKVNGVRYLDIMEQEILQEQMRRDEEKMNKERERQLKKTGGLNSIASNTLNITNNKLNVTTNKTEKRPLTAGKKSVPSSRAKENAMEA